MAYPLAGLDWSSRHPATQQVGFRKLSYSNKTVSMIIFELTGEFRCRKSVSSHYQVPKGVLDAVYPGVDSIRDDITDLTSNLQNTDKDDLIEDLVKRIQDRLTDLLSALEAKRTSVVETTTAPRFNFRFVGTYLSPNYFPFQPAIIERDTKIPANDLSLLRVSRFYRAECFAMLAPKMIYDFGFDVEALQDFSKAVSPAMLNSITQVRVTLVEGHMLPLPPLPELKMLHIDLWPRDPARSDSIGRAWGEQTETLLASLQTWAGILKVRLEMRWRDDCERFEREYVTNGAWVCVLEDGPDDQSCGNKDFCHRFYEL